MKKSDDTIFTQDKGSDRIYLNLGTGVRLRSHDPMNVVLEWMRVKPGEFCWVFEGFFPRREFLEGTYLAHKDIAEAWAGKRAFPAAVEHMLGKWKTVWSKISIGRILDDFDKLKEHERDKASVRMVEQMSKKKEAV